MPRFVARVTNAQRAAVCGLVIAGVTAPIACEIAGVSIRGLAGALPGGWLNAVRRNPRRLHKATVEKIRLEYMDRTKRAADIAKKYGIHPCYLSKLASRQGWTLRGRGHWGPRKSVLMTREQRLTFNKLRRHGIDLEQARAVALA